MPDDALHHAGCRVWLLRAGEVPRFGLDDGPAPQPDAAVDAAWAEMTAANPRLFNGPILACASYDPMHTMVSLRHDEYKRLAVRDRVRTGVLQLGVTGLLVAHGPDGTLRLLLGRRSPETRTYGGMWELAPSGGIEPSHGREETITLEDTRRALREEAEEELGRALSGMFDAARAAPVALVEDPIGGSLEIVLRCEATLAASNSIEPASWEYDALRWVPTDAISEFVATERDRIIPPTLALLAALDLR